MKYTVEIVIDLPRSKVVELFDDSENLKKWQPDLISFEHISGSPGQPGAKSKLLYKMGNREVEMLETIQENAFPERFSATFETKPVWNLATFRFEERGEGKTHIYADNEFKFKGFMAIMAIFLKGAFKKQTLKFLDQFRDYAMQEAGSAE